MVNIVLTLSDAEVGKDALNLWLKSLQSFIHAYNKQYQKQQDMVAFIAPSYIFNTHM